METKTKISFTLFLLCFAIMPFRGFTTNPDLSNYLINLSEGPEGVGLDDRVPEIVVEGNTVHTLWVQYASNEASLFYRRSADLGKTWEQPVLIKVLKYKSYAIEAENRRLAVEGNNVHIGVVDYDYSDNGTGRLFYIRSINNGASFESEKVIAATSGGYKSIRNSFIKVANGKVAIAYQGEGNKKGTWALFSGNGGTTFTDTKISEESNYLSDLSFDGNQMVVLFGYSYYNNGLSTGKVWAAVSQNGTSFTTNKISYVYSTTTGDKERSQVLHNYHYSPKIAMSGGNIHIVFNGYTENGYTTFYTRSNNNGTSFENAVNIGAIMPESLEGGSETVAAKNEYVYLLAASAYPTNNNSGNRFYLLRSENNGSTFAEPLNILDKEIAHVGKASLPGITLDPNDGTGKTLFLTGNWLFSTKSVDGGITFSGSTMLAPTLEGNIVNMTHGYMLSFMVIDKEGGKHWISAAEWRTGTDTDIFYRNVKAQPEPGSVNKALFVNDPEKTYQAELVAVPSSASINFDSAVTAEVWIKFDPQTMSNFNILAKVNGYDGYYDQPKGYQMGFQQEKEKIKINVGIKTDKGEFVNKSEFNLNDNLWHHIAFTYDANGGLNNFKLYINGLLQVEKTVIGPLFQADGMLMIGSRSMGSSWYYSSNYLLDDVRLWNRALTQDELIGNQTKKLSGKENGLKLFLNFDDTFKDISGNGNDGIPVYRGALNVSDFDPPYAAFEMYQSANEISLNNKTKNATSWLWDFGNTKTSDQGNPKYTYSTPGEYKIALTAKNATTVTSTLGHVTIKGLDRVEPANAGNIGESVLTIFGGGLNNGMKILLRAADNTEIAADTIVGTGEDGFLHALFTLDGAKTGLWDVVAKGLDGEMILPKTFTIKQAEGLAQPWVNVSGRSTVLLNRWNKFTITYGNKGDVDALMVPVSFAVPDIEGLEVDYMDFRFVLPELSNVYNLENELMPYKDFIISDNIFGRPEKSKIYSLMIPRIPANSSESLHILIKSPVDYKITSWTGDGWVKYANSAESTTKNGFNGEQLKSSVQFNKIEYQTGASVEVAECITEALAVTVIETSIGVIPVVGAIYNSGKTGYVVGQFDSKNKGRSVVNAGLQGASTFFSYAGVIPVVGWVASTVGGLICGGISAYLSVSDCLSLANKEKGVNTVSSFDPNEMIGPDGFGEKGWIQKLNDMPYTVLFENKAEATAPAHDVFITDTLDLTKFNLAEFGFGSFGWGDTILFPPGNNLKEFSMDVDLRPKINLITRVSGKLDTLTGIVRWEFLSLNPESMNLEEDPFIGFLPPNNSSSDGEGFVSFSVGLKKELATNSEIRNKASIVFDANQPIITNEYLNTLDLDLPESRVYPLKETLENHFLLEWTGSDKGSGIRYYTIYVLENDTLLYPWLRNTTALSAPFEVGELGSTYKFYSIATDNVSLLENHPADYDATTKITVDVEEFEQTKENLTVWPNPVKDNLQISFKNAPCGMYVVELISTNGSVKHSELYSDIQLQNGVNINVADCTSGQYVLRVVFGNKTETRKIVVQ